MGSGYVRYVVHPASVRSAHPPQETLSILHRRGTVGWIAHGRNVPGRSRTCRANCQAMVGNAWGAVSDCPHRMLGPVRPGKTMGIEVRSASGNTRYRVL